MTQRKHSLVDLGVEVPLLFWKGAEEQADVDEDEVLWPRPRFGDVVDFKDAVWWNPGLR